MASRRMFSIRLINSARFLKMPISSQALYFHLGLHADDDGIVEAYSVIKAVGCTEDDLRVLVAKNFVQVLNDDLVSYITDWKENNRVRPDRKIDSIYKDLLIMVNPNVELVQKRPRADVKKLPDNQWTTNGQPMDSIGKDSIGKDNKNKTKHKYGEYKNVLLTDEEYRKLKEMFPDLNDRIERLSEYVASTGKSYKSHYATIRAWSRREKKDADTGKPKLTDIDQRECDYDKLEELMRR